MKALPINNFRTALSSTIDQVEAGAPVVVTRKGAPSAVLLPVDLFNDLAVNALVQSGRRPAFRCASCRRGFVDQTDAGTCLSCGSVIVRNDDAPGVAAELIRIDPEGAL